MGKTPPPAPRRPGAPLGATLVENLHLITVRDLAARLSVSVATIYNWMRDPSFPVYRAKKRGVTRVDFGEVSAWLRKRSDP